MSQDAAGPATGKKASKAKACDKKVEHEAEAGELHEHEDSGKVDSTSHEKSHEEGEEEDGEEDPEIHFEAASKRSASVNPREQAALRQHIRSQIKPRGKSAAAKKKAAAASKKGSPKSKAKGSPKAKAKPKASPKAKSSRKSKASPKPKAKAKQSSPKKRGKRAVDRKPPLDADGNELALGCSNCRYAMTGCAACERADFKGKRRTDVSEEVISKAQQSLAKTKAAAVV